MSASPSLGGRRFPVAAAAGVLAIAALCAAQGCRPAGVTAEPSAADPHLEERKRATIRFWELFGQATGERTRGDFQRAAGLYEEALGIDPDHEDSLYYLGQCRKELGEFQATREAFARLVAVNPHSARGHQALGALLASPEGDSPFDLPAAETHFRRAHEINAEETGPMVRLGEVLIVRGDAKEARHWLEAALASNPKSVEAAFLLGYLAWEAGDASGAAALHDKALAAAKADAPVRGVLGEGDRRVEEPRPASDGTGAPQRVAPPPLRTPMGRTIFHDFCDPLRERVADADGRPAPAAQDPRAAYEPVRRFARGLAERHAASRGPAPPAR